MLSDPLQAINYLWLIGEGFLRSTLGTLQTLRTDPDLAQWSNKQDASDNRSRETTQARSSREAQLKIPYIYQNFRIKPFYQPNSGNSVGTLYKLFNSVVEGLNSENKLPKYILVLADRDLLLQVGHLQAGIGHILAKIINWLGKNIDRAISTCREQLRKNCRGP